jgi:hypothetical protein
LLSARSVAYLVGFGLGSIVSSGCLLSLC